MTLLERYALLKPHIASGEFTLANSSFNCPRDNTDGYTCDDCPINKLCDSIFSSNYDINQALFQICKESNDFPHLFI